MLGAMSQAVVFSAFVSALPQLAHDFGGRGEFIAQMTMALAALGVMFGALASGWILEKAGTRVTLLTSMLIYGLSGAGGLILRDPTFLLITRFAVGFASACMVTTCVWGIAAEYAGIARARALGSSYALSAITALSVTVLGGYLTQRGGWPLAFLPYPVFGLVGFILAFVSVRQVRPDRERPGETSRPYLKRLLPFYLLAMLVFAVMFMEAAQFAFLLEEDGIRDPTTRALIIGTITTVATLISFCYAPLQQRLGLLGTLTFGLGCMAVALTAVGLGVNPAYAVLGAALMGIHDGLVSPYLYHSITEHTDIFSRSRAIGLLTAFSFLGGFLNPLVIAPMRKAIGLRDVFLLVALIMLALTLGAAIKLMRRRGALRRQGDRCLS
jgi:MFS family permease